MDALIGRKIEDHENGRCHVPPREKGNGGDDGRGTPGQHCFWIRRSRARFGREDRCRHGMLVGNPEGRDADEEGLDHEKFAITNDDF